MHSILKITCVLLLVACAACTRQAKDLLTWRWSFEGVYMNGEERFIDSISNGEDKDEALRNFFMDYKLILRKDSSFDLVIFKKYLHGSWQYNVAAKMLVLSDEENTITPLDMQVDSISPLLLALHINQAVMNRLLPADSAENYNNLSFFRHNAPYIFVLSADKLKYNNEKSDPYSRQNNFWRLKPKQPETDEQIRQRVSNHVAFIKLQMQDVLDGKKKYISLHSFHTPLIVGTDFLSVHPYNEYHDSWNECFYDSVQAKKGFMLLEEAVDNNIKPGNASDRFSRNVYMLNQLLGNLGSTAKE